ncbi:hypothetical protein A7J42_11320 [Brucella intermedia]|nr:hypothetical protein A7J42_11320 [Brucella intermedia]
MRQNEEICHTVEFYLMQNPIPSTQFIATVRGTRHGMNLPLDLANRLVPDVLTAVEFLALTYRCGFLGPGGVNYLLKNLQRVLKRLEDGTLCRRHATDGFTVAAQDCVAPEPKIKGAADACKLPTNMRLERTDEDVKPRGLLLHRSCDATEFFAGFF